MQRDGKIESSRPVRPREASRDEVNQMSKVDACETEVLGAYEAGRVKSVATKAELGRLKRAARTAAIKERRVNVRLSSIDLSDIRTRALEEGVPYPALIASVLHKYVNRRPAETRGRTGRGSGGQRAGAPVSRPESCPVLVATTLRLHAGPRDGLGRP
jgi:predicted DNA binding CopG/RHH family protein